MFDSLRFQRLWSRIGVGDSSPILKRLHVAYSEPHRAYHNADHICDCLTQFDRVRSSAERPDEIETAIWFHDVVYDVRAKDNEERSADWAELELANAEVPADFRKRVSQLILATRHNGEPSTPDARLLVDIDLSIFAREPEVFDVYDRAIRREYEWVAEAEYRAARAAVLEQFLKRSTIYVTEPFRGLELPARRNLDRAIQWLRGN